MLWINLIFLALVEASEKKSESLDNVTDKKCPLCLMHEVEDYKAECKHLLCKICIVRSVENKNIWNCPYCRFDLTNNVSLKELVSERKKLEEEYRKITIHEACRRGLFDVINFYIENGVDLKSFDSSGRTPLQVTFNYGHRNIFNFLIEIGANINEIDKNGKSLLQYECANGNLEKVNYLISQGADPNIAVETEFTFLTPLTTLPPLLIACSDSNLKLIKILLLSGANLYARSYNGATPLRVAFRSNHLNRFEFIEFLIQNGENIHEIDKNGKSLLHHECAYGKENLESVEYLLAKSVDPNIIDDEGLTPLLVACMYGNLELIKILLISGANRNVLALYEDTPLRLACQFGSLEDIISLVNLGEILQNERELMHIAANSGNEEIVKYLIEKKVDVNSVDKRGYTPLHFAISKGYLKIKDILIDNGADASKCKSSYKERKHCIITLL